MDPPDWAMRREGGTWWQEGELIEGGSCIPGMFQDEIDQCPAPSLRRWGNCLAPSVLLQRGDNRRPVEPEPTVAFPQMALVLVAIGLPRTKKITGAAADEQAGDGVGTPMERLENPLVLGVGEIHSDAGGHHGADLTQGERARDVQEVTQRSGKRKAKR
jgi:hypothetical protein